MPNAASNSGPPGTCRRCGSPLPADAPGSACWRCIRDLALGSDSPAWTPANVLPIELGSFAARELIPTPRFADAEVAQQPPGPIRLGDYLLESPIAHGGMGVIYRARQIGLDRVVALKLLLLGRHSSPDSIRRFRREAQSAAALRHPHIVSVFDVGEAEGQPYIAMEFVDGRSLSEVLREGPLPPNRSAEYARIVADAIHYAHSRGVLHRDVKPSNVLLDAFGQIRLTDFGLAKKLDGSSDMTVTGEMLGSPNYLSPEQAAGRNAEVGPSSDLYGIGALLYELLTGRPPFMAPSIQDTLLLIRDAEPVPPKRLNPAVPRDLNTITLKCLEKNPSKRYASAGDLASDLGRFLRLEPIEAHPTPAWERNWKWVRRHRARAAVVATIALSLITLATGSLWFSFGVQRARLETEAANRRLARELFVREWNDAEHLLEEGKTVPALTWFARSARESPTNHVAATRLLSLLGELTLSIPFAKPLVHSNAVLSADFSPDGRYVVTASADGLVRLWPWQLPASPIVLPRAFVSPAVAWIPDTRHILVADRHALSLWSPDGTPVQEQTAVNPGVLRLELSRDGQRAVLISSDAPPQFWDITTLRPIENPAFSDRSLRVVGFSPSGRHLLRYWISESPQRWNLGLWSLHSGRRIWQVVAPDHPRAFHMHSGAISDDDSLAAICRWGGQTLVYRLPQIDADVAEPLQGGEPLLQWDFGEVTRVEAFRFLDHNRRLIVATTDGLVQQFDLESRQMLPDRLEHAGPVNATRVSPDGNTLATASVDGQVRFWDLRLRRPEPRILQRSNVVWDVAFAPDRSELVIAGDPDAAIYDYTTGTLRHRLPMGKLVSQVAYSPDGRRIVTSTEQGSLRVWNSQTGEPVTPPVAVAKRIHDLSISEDGRWILIAGPSDRIRILDAETASPALPELATGADIVESAMTSLGTRLVAGTVHGDVHFWSLPDAQVIPASHRHRGVVWATRASRDGNLVVTASGDQTAVVWNPSSARVVREFRAEKAVYVAMFSPDNRRIVIGSADRTARIRDLETGRQTSETMNHPGGVWFAQFSPDGRLVATGDDAGYARLWDAESGLPISNWLRSGSTLKRIAFSPDGKHFATTSADQTGRVWPVVVAPSPAPGWLPDLAEAVAGRRLEGDGTLQATPFEFWQTTRERLAGIGGADLDFYALWARWFFTERLAENPAPFTGLP